VFLVEHIRSGKKFVSKRIPVRLLGENERRGALQEANLLRNLKHVHIVEYIESYIENNALVIIMEYCSGGLTRGRPVRPYPKVQGKRPAVSGGTGAELVRPDHAGT
jgi:serine/threonine protein kinase